MNEYPGIAAPHIGAYRNGLTLLELLAALVILSGLVIAVAPWVPTASRIQTTDAPRLQWRTSAQAVLQLISDDLSTGDLIPAVTQRRRARQGDKDNKVSVDDAGTTLVIKTRIRPQEIMLPDASTSHAAGPCERRYRLDREDHTLHVRTYGVRNGRVNATELEDRILLTDTAEWSCSLEVSQEDKDFVILTVRMAHRDGSVISERFVIRP